MLFPIRDFQKLGKKSRMKKSVYLVIHVRHLYSYYKALLPKYFSESEWPYECPFCSKRFQAKGDLPKHFFTLKHKQDPRIPAFGTQDWIDLLNSCRVLNVQVRPKRMRTIHRRRRQPEDGPILMEQNFFVNVADAAETFAVENLSEQQQSPQEEEQPQEELLLGPSEECILPDEPRALATSTLLTQKGSQNNASSKRFCIDDILGTSSSPEIQTDTIFIKCELEEEPNTSLPADTGESIS